MGTSTDQIDVKTARLAHPGKEEQIRRAVLLLLGLFILGVMVVGAFGIVDPDIWWHLRTGQWVVQHGTVPATDPFSSYGAANRWIAYSWLFDLLVYGLFQSFGLAGLVYYNIALSLAIAVALFALITRLEAGFLESLLLTLLCVAGMLPILVTPRSWLFTIFFFVITLNVLLTARRTGSSGKLWLLPAVFAVWANLHVQFVYGFFLLGLATAESFFQKALDRFRPVLESNAIAPRQMVVVSVACGLATLVNPYNYRLYLALLDLFNQSGFYDLITELQAPQFRIFTDYLVLALVVAASFAIGLRRRVSPFVAIFFSTGLFVSFRSQRDIWFVTIAAVVAIAQLWPGKSSDRFVPTWKQIAAIVLILPVLIGFSMRRMGFSEALLQQKVAEKLPVAAASVVEHRGYSGPLYNQFEWGGYLIWRLQTLPVAIDGRSNIYGVEKTIRSLKVWSGTPDWAADSELAASRLVIAERDKPLSSLLKLDPRFELVYEDQVALVFISRPGVSRR